MDSEFQGLIWTFGLNSSFLLGAYLVFQFAGHHKALTDKGKAKGEHEPLLHKEQKPAVLSRTSSSLAPSDAPRNIPLPGSQVLEFLFGAVRLRSTTALLLLRFMQWCIVLSIVLALTLDPILIPLYVGETDADPGPGHPTWLQEISAGNLPIDSPKLIAPFVFVFFVTALAMFLGNLFIGDVRATQGQIPSAMLSDNEKLARRTLHIRYLDERVVDDAVLQAYFESHFGNRVADVSIIRDMTAVSELLQKRKEVSLDIERCMILEAREGVPLRARSCKRNAPLLLPILKAQKADIDRQLEEVS